MRPSFASLRRVTKPRPSRVDITPVAVGRLMPTAAAKSRASISPHTHSTQSPTNDVHESRSGARTFDSMWRRIAVELRKRFESAAIARKSSGRSPSCVDDPSLRGQAVVADVCSCGGAPAREPLAQLPRHLEQREHVVLGRAEVHEARAQPDLAVDQRRRQVDAAVGLDRLGERPGCARSGPATPAGTWRNGTIDSCGGASRTSKSSVAWTPAGRGARPPRGCARSRRGTARPRARGTPATASGRGTAASTRA